MDTGNENAGDERNPIESTTGQAGKSDEDDKFLELTRKTMDSVEKTIASSYKKAKSAIETAHFDPMISVKLLDRFLEWIRRIFPPEKFEALSKWLVRYGHTGMFTAAILSFLFWIIAAIAESSRIFVLYSIGCAALLLILQYTASKFLHAGGSLINSSPSRLASRAFLDCLALLMEIAGILFFLGFLMRGQLSYLVVGLGAWALCDSIAYIALHPSMANITISEDTPAGEEAIGIMSFLVKAVVRIVPIAFGVGSIIGLVALLIATFSLLFGGTPEGGRAALKLIIFCACLPFFSYIFFALYHLTIDVLRAILVLPRKFDEALKK